MLNSFIQTIIVTPDQTAEHLGSGLLPVFSTPAMIALMENTAMKCINDLSEQDSDATGSMVGEGTHDRVVVNIGKFMSRL